MPQGSVLGPLLFLLFINDLAAKLENPCFIFADDVKIAGARLSDDIEKVKTWSRLWDLPLNNTKCQILTAREEDGSQGLEPYRRVAEVKDLGVIVTNDFKPSRQCQQAAQKARGELFRLYATIKCREPEVFVPLYRAIVRPHLEYCVQAWSPYYRKDIECLEKVQHLATRMITGQRGKDYPQRLRDLNLFSLERRRTRGDLIEVFKIVKGISGNDFDDFFRYIPDNGTRGHRYRLRRNHSRLEVRAKFFTNRVIPLWNKLPNQVVDCTTVDAFKRALDGCWEYTFNQLEV